MQSFWRRLLCDRRSRPTCDTEANLDIRYKWYLVCQQILHKPQRHNLLQQGSVMTHASDGPSVDIRPSRLGFFRKHYFGVRRETRWGSIRNGGREETLRNQ